MSAEANVRREVAPYAPLWDRKCRCWRDDGLRQVGPTMVCSVCGATIALLVSRRRAA